jgi:hypothetical protein
MAVKMGHRFVDLMTCCSCRLLSFKFSSILFADSVGLVLSANAIEYVQEA